MTLPRQSLHGSILEAGYSLEEMLALAKRFGLPGVDASFGAVRALVEETSPASVRDLFAAHGALPAFMGFIPAGIFSPEAEFKQSLDQFSENCAVAASVGCRRTGSYFPNRMSLPPDEARRILRDRTAYWLSGRSLMALPSAWSFWVCARSGWTNRMHSSITCRTPLLCSARPAGQTSA